MAKQAPRKPSPARRRDALMSGEVEKWIRVIGIPKAELCQQIGIGLSTLNEHINDPGEFRITHLRAIADLAGVDISQLVT